MNSSMFFRASTNPEAAMAAVTYQGQPAHLRMYRGGYEDTLNQMPRITPDVPFIKDKMRWSKEAMQNLAARLREADWVQENFPSDNEFDRTVLALEDPQISKSKVKEGVELVVARWGNGYSSPVHGHAAGYMHEEIIFGKMRVNTYRLVDGKARTVKTEIVGQGTFVSDYATPDANAFNQRTTLIHNFTSVGSSASLHYLPEHTRDGRDNTYSVDHFDDRVGLTRTDVKRITSFEGMYLPKGEVVLVRSTNVPEYGDHYIVITGMPVLKEHGLRPQDVAIQAPTNQLLDLYELETGLTLLKLEPWARDMFLDFHGITIVNKEVIFPTA